MIRLPSVATPCGATSARLTRKQLQHQVSLNMEVRLARLGSHLFDLLTVLQILPPSASFSICHFLHGEHLGSCKGKYTMDHHGTSTARIEKQFINSSGFPQQILAVTAPVGRGELFAISRYKFVLSHLQRWFFHQQNLGFH